MAFVSDRSRCLAVLGRASAASWNKRTAAQELSMVRKHSFMRARLILAFQALYTRESGDVVINMGLAAEAVPFLCEEM